MRRRSLSVASILYRRAEEVCEPAKERRAHKICAVICLAIRQTGVQSLAERDEYRAAVPGLLPNAIISLADGQSCDGTRRLVHQGPAVPDCQWA